MQIISVDEDRCALCGACIAVCPRRMLKEEDGSIKIIDPAQCILCGHCKAVCPEDAFQFPGLEDAEFAPVPQKATLPAPEGLMALFRSRRSTRIFRKQPVEREKIERIMEAGRFAPTGGNRQPLRYTVITTPSAIETVRGMTVDALVEQADRIKKAVEKKRESGEALSAGYKLQEIYAGIWHEMAKLNSEGVDVLFFHAPALIVCHGNPAWTGSLDVDSGLSGMQMALMAEVLGLGTCFCGFLVMAAEANPELKQTMQIPKDHKVILSFMIGYPDVTYLRLVSRKPARVHWL